jgi:carboxyl-terminal processing protease
VRQLADVFGLIKSDYVEPVEDKKLLTEAISGMVASLDPHSAYLDKKAYAELREGSQGKFVGLGIEIGQSEDGYIKIVAPIEDSPAWRAGIKPGDLISRLDNSPSRASLDDSIKKMRGEPNSKVSLTVLRKGEPSRWCSTSRARKSTRRASRQAGRAGLRLAAHVAIPGADRGRHGGQDHELYKQDPTSRAWCWTCATIRAACCRAPSAWRPPSCRRTRRSSRPTASCRTEADLLRPPEYYACRTEAMRWPSCRPPSSGADGGAGQHGFGLGLGNRRRRAAGLQARRHHRHADLRQGLGANHPPADGRHAVKLTTARYYTPNGRSIQAKGITPDVPWMNTPTATA